MNVGHKNWINLHNPILIRILHEICLRSVKSITLYFILVHSYKILFTPPEDKIRFSRHHVISSVYEMHFQIFIDISIYILTIAYITVHFACGLILTVERTIVRSV